MEKTTIKRLKMVKGKSDDFTEDKINFIREILNDEECPLTFETDINYIEKELSMYKFESKKMDTIIKKSVTPLFGKIKYKDNAVVKSLDGFIETNYFVSEIDSNCIAYIEECKLITKDNVCKKIILSKKIVVFSGSTISKLSHLNAIF